MNENDQDPAERGKNIPTDPDVGTDTVGQYDEEKEAFAEFFGVGSREQLKQDKLGSELMLFSKGVVETSEDSLSHIVCSRIMKEYGVDPNAFYDYVMSLPVSEAVLSK